MKRPLTVPWLVLTGGQDWLCQRCRQTGTLPSGCSIRAFVRFIDELMRDHRDCREP